MKIKILVFGVVALFIALSLGIGLNYHTVIRVRAEEENLIMNPGFEEGFLYWDPDEQHGWWQISTTGSHSGSKCAETDSGSFKGQLYTAFPYYPEIKNGVKYKISLWVKLIGVSGESVNAHAYIAYKGGEERVYLPQPTSSKTDWQCIETTFTAKGDGSLYLYINVECYGENVKVLVDDVGLCVVSANGGFSFDRAIGSSTSITITGFVIVLAIIVVFFVMVKYRKKIPPRAGG